MKLFIFTILTAAITIASNAWAISRCEGLFPEPITPYKVASDSNRIEIMRVSKNLDVSKLQIEESAFSADPKVAVIELIRMLVKNSDYKLEDKNVLIKNKFTLGVPLKDGYSLMLSYESKSSTDPRFVLQDKILLVTPTGKEIKVTDELINSDSFKINKSEFKLDQLAETGLNFKLKAPLVVQGELLKNFSDLANYFEYFDKQELRTLFNKSDSLFKIKTHLTLRKAKSVFYNVLIKEPFKFAIGGALMFAVFNSHLFMADDAKVVGGGMATPVYISETFNKLQLPPGDKDLKQQFAEIQLKSVEHQQSLNYSNLKFGDIPIHSQNSFSMKNNLFVFERVNENTLSTHTYLVFSNDISNQMSAANSLGMQYFVMEINAVKYERLIKYIKNNGLLPAEEAIREGELK